MSLCTIHDFEKNRDVLETDELLRPEETGSRKWRLKVLILEGEMSFATNFVRRFGPSLALEWHVGGKTHFPLQNQTF
jgi:hypothetical protein